MITNPGLGREMRLQELATPARTAEILNVLKLSDKL